MERDLAKQYIAFYKQLLFLMLPAENWIQKEKLNLPVWTNMILFFTSSFKSRLMLEWMEFFPTQLLFRDLRNELSMLISLPLLSVLNTEQESHKFGCYNIHSERCERISRRLRCTIAIKRQPGAVSAVGILWTETASQLRWLNVTFFKPAKFTN